MEIKIYNNIIEDHTLFNSWKSEEQFSLKKIGDTDFFKDLCVIELRYNSTNRNSTQFDLTLNALKTNLSNFIKILNGDKYVFKTEHKYMSKSKIRTYKGIIPRLMNKSDYIEFEKNRYDNSSLIGGIIKFNYNQFSELFNLVMDSSNSFLFITNDFSFFSSETINEIIENNLNEKEVVNINYATLIKSKILTNNDIIIRMSGDGGVNYFGVQIFCHKEIKDLLMLNLETTT